MIEIPAAWVGPAIFAAFIALIGYLAKAKADRWDATATRQHDHANTLQTHELRLTHLEKKKDRTP